MEDLLFRQWNAPGDLVVLTVALRDLHLTYPEKFRTQIISCYPEVFYKNPYQSSVENEDNENNWDYVWYSEQKSDLLPTGAHFTDAFIYAINQKFGLNIRKTTIWPELYLDDDEKDPDFLEHLGIRKPYWVINPGIKVDHPLKQYPPFYWQSVINYLNLERNKFGFPIVQAGHSYDMHPQLSGVKNLVGKTDNLRDYFALIYHSEGTMGHISLHMHVAAAFRKKCVVVAGGREGFRWEAYPGHQFLHTTGLIPCSKPDGCWHSTPGDCEALVNSIPKCYRMIKPHDVVNTTLKYYCK